MSITISANVADDIDYAAIRADGYQAEITAQQCGDIARLVEPVEGVTSYPAGTDEEEAFYGSYVPSLAVCLLPQEMQARILEILEGNEAARDIVHKAMVNRIRATFTRDCGDQVYRVRLVSERADNVDLNLCSGNWKGFRDAVGMRAHEEPGECDFGHVEIAEVERALDDSHAAIMFSGEYHRSVAQRLRAVAAYAKSRGATQLHWG